jgi:hypothetical protein
MIREAELPPVFHGISTISQAITGKISPKPLISVQVDCFENFASKVSEWNTLQPEILLSIATRDFTKTGGEGGPPSG